MNIQKPFQKGNSVQRYVFLLSISNILYFCAFKIDNYLKINTLKFNF